MSSEFFPEIEDDSVPATSNVAELTVSEISGQLKRMVEDAFGRVRVRGEIGRVSRPASGHIYMDLKDDRSVLAAVVWKGGVSKLMHRPEEGMEVIATGKLTTFPGSSKYQIIIEQIEPAGAGALMALLEERKKKLAAEGLFEPERKQLLPYLPMTIGVITSPTGAVIRDILHRISDRFPMHVIVWPVRVQGETSGKEVAWAINGFNALEEGDAVKRPDVLIVARGGGSVEDLWGFNDEAVVRAAANSMIPIVSAVGHETDWTLVDLAADVRAPTPTGAAEMIVPVKADLEAHVATLTARLRSGLLRTLDSVKTKLKAASRGLPTADSLFAVQSQRYDNAATGLSHGFVSAVQQKQLELQRCAGKLTLGLLKAPVDQKKQRLSFAKSRLDKELLSDIQLKRRDVNSLRLSWQSLERSWRKGQDRLDYTSRTMIALQTNRMIALRGRLDGAGRLLGSLSHENTLERGFTLLRDTDGNVITRAAATKNGAAYQVEFADERIDVIRNDLTKRPASISKKTPSDPSSDDQPRKQGNLFQD
ncbi:MAG: exodeoxyribonuclease VII large subunit [Salaquimonas sp.]